MATLQAVADKLSLFPGNSLGSTNGIGQFPTGDAVKVGEGAKQVSWSAWLADVASFTGHALVSPFGAVMPTAADIVRTAGQETASLVKKAEDRVTSAATGISSTIKYLAWGLVALAILYALALFGPALAAPLAGKK